MILLHLRQSLFPHSNTAALHFWYWPIRCVLSINWVLVLRLEGLSHKALISSMICNIHTSVTFAKYLGRVVPVGKAVPGTTLYYVCGLYLVKL